MNEPSPRWINARVSNALADAFSKIEKYVTEGYCTEDDVFLCLNQGWGEGVAEGWCEWIEEYNA